MFTIYSRFFKLLMWRTIFHFLFTNAQYRGTMGTPLPHIWQKMSSGPRSQGDSRDEAGEEAAQKEEETSAILDRSGRLAKAESK
jgi:hypothetical protein